MLLERQIMELGGTELQRSVLGGRQGVAGSCLAVSGAPYPAVGVQDGVHELQAVAPSVLVVAPPLAEEPPSGSCFSLC